MRKYILGELSKMKTIITIHHTQSVHHTNGMVGSWTDWDLTELGVNQAINIGKKLQQELSGRAFIMYTSDLKRSKQTADHIAAYLGLKPILRNELRERNLGKCCGKSVHWLKENMELQEKTVDDRLFSDAESRRDVWNRLKPFFNEIMTNNERNIIIVSHGDLLSVFYAMFMSLEAESLNHSEIFGLPGGVSYLHENETGKRIIKKISDMSYIK